jgi:excisionase family DNA binding protein
MRKKDEKMFTAREAAEKLGESLSSVRVWIHRGRFPNASLEQSPVGSYWLIPESDLKGFIKHNIGRPPKPESKKKAKKG